MEDVVNALKSKGLIGGPQKALLAAMPGIGNAAMHSDWDKNTPNDAGSVLGFGEQFLLAHSSRVTPKPLLKRGAKGMPSSPAQLERRGCKKTFGMPVTQLLPMDIHSVDRDELQGGLFLPVAPLLAKKTTPQTAGARLITDRRECAEDSRPR